MRYIRRRNLEHHSEAINLLAALQATMHFFFFLLFFFVFDRVFLRHDRAMLGKSSMDTGKFVEWDNFLFINQNYEQVISTSFNGFNTRFLDFMQNYLFDYSEKINNQGRVFQVSPSF